MELLKLRFVKNNEVHSDPTVRVLVSNISAGMEFF